MDTYNPSRNGNALIAEGLGLMLDDGQRPPFKIEGLHLRLDAGALVVLQGASGCGKSTLLLALARLVPLAAGGLSLDGIPAQSCPAPAWRARVSLAPAEHTLLEGSIMENLLLPWSFQANRAAQPPAPDIIQEGMARLGLDGIDTQSDVKSLSTGQAARVALLRHLLLRPDYLLLDEPTANLDPETAKLVWRALEQFRAETGAGVLAATHHKGRAKPDRVLRLKHGKLEGA